ncbi:MvaI/BcnI family restriction endonuclease [Clostridium estertheticum]|uniref:MvaI/BcnI family restriction endonuclease n=1 Tax=Clostridium estertheticum TaxID=238834 RepID=UPI001CF31661|nr:MvaI/BcnI family restriction endonuclease [Clostridium estertheticum]MCB2354731.1 MvaI/BcnI family restriction endonuclease [Clostridium estertheticum]WAG40973.1 MvaI/BcnI family restriction endonuclease [Clostridium estertheticum]
MLFLPNLHQQNIITKIDSIYHHEYALVTLTPTMLRKSIMDASGLIRKLLRENGIVNYKDIGQGPEHKIELPVTFIGNEIYDFTASFYRPKTKDGDPRFWIKGMKKEHVVNVNTMLYLTSKDNSLVIIPLDSAQLNYEIISKFLGDNTLLDTAKELVSLLKNVFDKDYVISTGRDKRSPKDVGETFERELEISPNSSKLADFKDLIELKAKRSNVHSLDTLFSMVPDYSCSPIQGSNEMIRTYGYPSTRHPEFLDLFITVSNFEKITLQGLYLQVDEEKEEIQQWHLASNGKKTLTCVWHFKDVEYRLRQKHSTTLWVLATEMKKSDNNYYFHYNKAQLSRHPLFSSFITLVQQGIITYDWRGRVRADGTGYNDKGHCWRVSPKNRKLLFGEVIDIPL